VKRFKFNNKGFTLIETVIAIAIVGLVITMAFSLLVFGQNFFSNSNTQYGIQNDGRITSSYLSKELRFATEIEIIDVSEAKDEIQHHESIDEPYDYFYIENGKLHHYIYDSSNYTNIGFGNSISEVSSEFIKKDNKTLGIVIESEDESKKYNLDTEISLDNLKLNDKNIIGDNNLAVKYKTTYNEEDSPDDEDEEEDEDTEPSDDEYTVQFYNIENGTDFTKNVTHGNSLGGNFPSAPVRTGYSFKEWNTMMDGNGASFTSTTQITGNMTVYVQWDAKTYTITFDKNNPKATNPSPNNKTVTYDSTYGSLPIVSYDKKVFLGWYTDKNHGTKVESGTIVDITNNLTLYAHWGNK